MVTTAPAGTPVSAESLGRGGEVLCSAIDCGGVDPAVMAATVLAATTAVLLALATFVHVSEGTTLVDAERRRSRTEREALAEFASQVERIDAAAALADGKRTARAGSTARCGTATRHGTTMQASGGPDDSGLAAVREAYRETVLSVPHFEREYEESLAANLAAEFGDDVATAVVSGSWLTPGLKRELLTRAREAADHRRKLLDALDREAESLSGARERLRAIESELEDLDDCRYREPVDGDLSGRWQRLGALEADCTDLLADRQHGLRETAPGGGRRGDGLCFYEYVYRPLSVSFPVLADATTLLERVRDARRGAVEGLTGRA